MAGTLQVTQRQCPTCARPVSAERSAAVWGVGDLLMILVTCGAWLPLKFAWNFWRNPWRCKTCGARC